jgi:CBS domain-containing protein
MGPALESILTPQRSNGVNGRVVVITLIAVAIGLAAGLIAQILLRLIGLITNLAFYGRMTTEFSSPAGNHLGLLVIVVPSIGGLIVGLMARYGSEAIRGHGIPEVMEQVLRNQSRILLASYQVVSLRGDQTLTEVRAWIAEGAPGSTHHGFPVADPELGLIGLVSRRDLLEPSEPATKRVRDIVRGPFVVAFEDTTLREARDLMAREGLGRIPVVERENLRTLVAIISGSDVRSGIRQRLGEADQAERTLHWH